MKTFNSAGSSPRKLEVEPEVNNEYSLCVVDQLGKYHAIFMDSDTAPALCLAILEAALGSNEGISMELAEGLSGLRREVRRVEERDKANRELAKLEAEALELFNANQGTDLDDWKYADRSVVSSWVRVARRAREMAKEAPSA